MRILTEKLLFAVMGFLLFRRAEGMGPDIPGSYPERHMTLRMNDGCTGAGPLNIFAEGAPNWLQPNHPNINELRVFIRTPEGRFERHFDNMQGISAHNDQEHTPETVQIHLDSGAYYTNERFQDLSQQRLQQLRAEIGFPPNNYIFVTVPLGGLHYARLQGDKYKNKRKFLTRLTSLFCGSPPKRQQSPYAIDHLVGQFGFLFK